MFFEAKCVKLLRSKGFLLSKVFFEAKCASAVALIVSQTQIECNKYMPVTSMKQIKGESWQFVAKILETRYIYSDSLCGSKVMDCTCLS